MKLNTMKQGYKKMATVLGVMGWLAGPGMTTAALAQGSGSHGGDGLVFEFTGTARNLAQLMSSSGELNGCPAADLFTRTVSTDPNVPGFTSVKSEPIVLVDFVEQDASTDPATRTITLNRSRLINLTDPLTYLNVVMHEYFVMLGLESTNDNSKSLTCIESMRNAGVTSAQLSSTVFRISPITTFERQFSRGYAGLQCGGGYVFLVSDVAREIKGKFMMTQRNAAGVLQQKSSLDDMARTLFDEYLLNFKSEYSVASGVTTFKARFIDDCNEYGFSTLDHVNWTVVGIRNNPNCYVTRIDGTRESLQVGSVFFQDQCRPLYFQQRPIVNRR